MCGCRSSGEWADRGCIQRRIVDGFSSVDFSGASNRNGFFVSIEADGSCGARFDRNVRGPGIWNHREFGPVFGDCGDLAISRDCNENEESRSNLGHSYGAGPEANETTLFGERNFILSEVFKIEFK
jgi:hypothetical protein